MQLTTDPSITMLPTCEPRREEELCSRITSAQQLRQAQEFIARFAGEPTAVQELPLPAAAGRILARDIELKLPGHEELLPAGSKLDWRARPLLAASGCATVPVRAPVRCGIVVIQKKLQSEASALLVQTAFEQMGGQAFRAWADGADAKQETAALQMFSKFCDLILVVGARDDDDEGEERAGALCQPRVFTVAESVCVDLPTEPQAALSSFVSFVVPLVRRLQGRPALPAPPRRAIDESSAPIGGEMVWVSARGEGASLRVRSSRPAPSRELQSLAEISGIAWKAEDIAAQSGQNAVAFLPFHEWLD